MTLSGPGCLIIAILDQRLPTKSTKISDSDVTVAHAHCLYKRAQKFHPTYIPLISTHEQESSAHSPTPGVAEVAAAAPPQIGYRRGQSGQVQCLAEDKAQPLSITSGSQSFQKKLGW